MNTHFDSKRIARIGVLAALSALIYLIPGIPIVPPIYKLDFSTVPVVIAALVAGPVDALIVLVIKDLTGLLHSSSMGVGELADFLCSAALIFPVWLMCRKRFSGRRMAWGSVLSVLSMAVVGAIVNYFIMIPFYVNVMNFPLEKIIALIGDTISYVTSLPRLIAFATVPFNLFKGAVICVLAWPLYRALVKAEKRI